MPNILIKKLNFSYKKRKTEIKVLKNLSMSFKDKTFNVILGPSGCGKSTLLRCIAGLETYEGNIYFDDLEMENVNVKDRELAYVTQEYSLYPHFTIFDNIAYPLKVAGAPSKEIRQRVDEISSILEINHILSRKVSQISIGQKQRVAIARALIKRPTVCLLDEPLSNLDSVTRSELLKLFKKVLRLFNSTIIYVTHRLEEATYLADQMYLLNDGSLMYQGTPLEVVKSKDKKVMDFIDHDEED